MKNKPKTAQQLAKDNVLVKHLAGSHSYGTALPTSDVDYRGIFVGDPINVRTPFFRVDEVSVESEEDTKLYELSNFVKLAVENNPNIIETLFVDEADIVVRHSAFSLLREAAPKFLTRKIAFTTAGYAFQQMKRIRGHNKHINNPQPVEAPQQADFMSLIQHFSDNVRKADFSLRDYCDGWRLIPYGKHTYGLYKVDGYSSFNKTTGNLNDDFDGDEVSRDRLGYPMFVVKFNHQQYQDARQAWEQYWEWKKNRNPARSVLEEEHGYDTKHAMHLVRLLRMGHEAITEGKLLVKRPDAEELLAIRSGAWTYDELIEYAEELDHKTKQAVNASVLPERVNLVEIAELVISIQDAVWRR